MPLINRARLPIVTSAAHDTSRPSVRAHFTASTTSGRHDAGVAGPRVDPARCAPRKCVAGSVGRSNWAVKMGAIAMRHDGDRMTSGGPTRLRTQPSYHSR